ncbi:hypothetical protein AGMMS50284_6670 [Clostridia bacterium]|nr:hypothetical protein AGMMS50284_6670 [Clostridia bacterium]
MRIIAFNNVPGGLNQDEASMGYDAFATTFFGIDRNGTHMPSYAMAWGSGQNVLMMYFSCLFIRIFGMNVFAIRFTSLIFGIAAPVILYFLVKRINSKNSIVSALSAFFLLSISPWHIMLSRWALESNLLPVFFLIACYLLVLGIQKQSTLFLRYLAVFLPS